MHPDDGSAWSRTRPARPADFRPPLLGYMCVQQSFRAPDGPVCLSLQLSDQAGWRWTLDHAVAGIAARQLYEQLGVQRPPG